MKKRIFALVLVLALAVGFGACTQQPKAPQLVYWTVWEKDSVQGQAIARAVEAFTAKTGVLVDVSYMGENIREKLPAALEEGTVVDLFDEDLSYLYKNWGEQALGLDAFIAHAYDDTGESTYGETLNSTILGWAQTIGSNEIFEDGNALHGIPYQPEMTLVLYNKDLFEAAGIEEAPKTWEEFEEACAKLKAADIVPSTADETSLSKIFDYAMSRLVGAAKVTSMVADKDFSDEAVLQFAETWQKFIENGYLSANAAANVWPAGQNEEFGAGTAAMYLGSTAAFGSFMELAPDTAWGSFAWPAMEKVAGEEEEAAAGDSVNVNGLAAKAIAIQKDSHLVDEAFSLIRWLVGGGADADLANGTNGIPMGTETAWPDAVADAQDILKTNTRLAMQITIEKDAEVTAAVVENLAKLTTGEISPQEFADALAALNPKAEEETPEEAEGEEAASEE